MTNAHYGSIAAILVVMIGLGFVGESDYKAEVAQQDFYCEMVGQWKAEADQGVAPRNRAGWPDFRGQYAEVCQ